MASADPSRAFVRSRPMRHVETTLVAALVLGAWAVAASCLDDLPFARRAGPWALESVALALLVVLASLGAGTRFPRLRRLLATALLGSVPMLPFLHRTLLGWLSGVLVGDWGDAFWALSPGLYYGFEDLCRFPAWVPAQALPALVLACLPLSAALGRGRWGRALLGVAFGVVACLVGAAALAAVTRPAHQEWSHTLPVLARILVARVTVGGRDWRDRPPGTALAAGVEVLRAWSPADDPGAWPETILVRPPGGEGDHDWGGALPLTCARESTLTLLAFPRGRRLLLSCGHESDPRNWGDEDNARRGRQHVQPLIEVHSWEHRVYRFEALGLAAPPPAWTLLGAGGLLLAAALVYRARPRTASPPRDGKHPYREPATGGGVPALIDERGMLLRAAAMAAAVHLSAPLALLGWTHAIVR